MVENKLIVHETHDKTLFGRSRVCTSTFIVVGKLYQYGLPTDLFNSQNDSISPTSVYSFTEA